MEERSSYDGWPRTVAVIGGGTMGLGVAECFAAAGMSVRLTDATPEMTREAKERLVERMGGHAEGGCLSEPGGGRGGAGGRGARGAVAAQGDRRVLAGLA